MNRTSRGFKTAVMIEHRLFGAAVLAMLLLFGKTRPAPGIGTLLIAPLAREEVTLR